MSNSDWYQPKRRLHFDGPLSRHRAAEIVLDPSKVASRSFWPFLKLTLWTPPSQRAGQTSWKPREVAYASHLDHYIYRKYAIDLSEKYERALAEAGCENAVLAYRSLDGKCNIHFARDVFEMVRSRAPVSAVAIDVKSFFDTISHRELLACWREVCGTKELPEDHYRVFRSISKWAWVDRDEIFRIFRVGRRRRRCGYGPVCSADEFRAVVRGGGMIRFNDKPFGIPQGSSISAVASNVAMLRIDRQCAGSARSAGAVYRRYSDDILLIGESKAVADLESELVEMLSSVGLQVNQSKTERARFEKIGDAVCCDTHLGYLGFDFDGEKVRLRKKTVGRFRQRRADAVRRLTAAALANPGTPVRRRRIYERFSPLGKHNFYSYARKAAKAMADDGIERQIHRDWNRLRRDIREVEDRL